MSDTKWRKLFTTVCDSGWKPSLVAVKFINSDQSGPQMMRWPGPGDFWGPPQWVDTLEFGPIELRSIEWLTIPANVANFGMSGLAASGAPQDLDLIMAALRQVGEFPIERSAEGLKIVGYR